MIRLNTFKTKIVASLILLLVIIHFVNQSNYLSLDRFESYHIFDDGTDSKDKVSPITDYGNIEQNVGSTGDLTAVDSAKGANNEAGSDGDSDLKVYEHVNDYSAFIKGLESFKVNAAPLKDKYKTQKAKELFYTHKEFLFSKEYLENILDLPDTTVNELKESHRKYVDEHIKKLVDEIEVSTFGNIMKSDLEWSSFEGSKGIVIIGGGKYSWLSYLVIRQIRLTGSTLPIELFIPSKDEYEKKFCEKLLPKYNARCNVVEERIVKTLSKDFKVGGYQFKMLAFLTSRFENILYIDSDNFPVKNVDYLFEEELFTKNGLILWPDAWSRTTNPKYYDIANIEVKENKIRYSEYDKNQAQKEGLSDVKPLEEYTFANSNFHDFEGTLPNPASETGMILINKTKQLKTLLLAFYYNLLGPDFYYPLMTQGSAGEGDKETFIAAAHVMKQPWHQTLKPFKWVGYKNRNTMEFDSKALFHYDPTQASEEKETGKDPDFIFAHLSYPKMYPNWLVELNELKYPDLDDHIRMYGSIKEKIGYDFDVRILGMFAEGFCPDYANQEDISLGKLDGYMGNYLQFVKNSKYKEYCESLFVPHANWLKSTAE